MTKDQMRNWVAAYIKAYEDPNDEESRVENYWAIELFFSTADEDPRLCLKAILNVLNQDPNEHVLGILGAGQLENLIYYHGEAVIEDLEFECKINPEFKQLLNRVWLSRADEVLGSDVIFARVEKARRASS